MDKIYIKGLRVWAYHGVNPSEQEKGQPFELDITIGYDLSAAGCSDDLSQTINYSKAAKRAIAVMLEEKNALIERAATRVADALLAEFPADEVTVLLKKPRAPVAADFDYVAVEITRRAAHRPSRSVRA